MKSRRHIVFVQHGDYAEAVERFAAGGGETYASQRYSVGLVGGLAENARVTVICLPAPVGEHRLSNGVVSIGMGWKHRRNVTAMLRRLEQLDPTDLIVRTPLVPVLGWGLLRRRRVLPLLADSFQVAGSRTLHQRLLAWVLNSASIPVVGNHNVAPSGSLVDLGVERTKVVPWDWPQPRKPEERPSKVRLDPSAPFTVFYAGVISEAKGVADLVRAIRLAARAGVDVRLVAAGGGDLDGMTALAEGVQERVTFLGRVPNTRVFELMCESDAVVVPSRHSYPEGLPMVITEGLCSRSPLVLSDHPVFQAAFRGQHGVRFFEAERPQSLADALCGLASDSSEYARLSVEGAAAWHHVQVDLTWGELVLRWLSGTAGDLDFLRQHALGSSPSQAH